MELKRIESFCVDHNLLERGIYTSRIDGDVTTYDIRMRVPNRAPFLENVAMHTIEHLFATLARNSEYANRVIYFGPMGCRTGFYFLTRDIAPAEVIALIIRIFEQIAVYEGEVPGSTAKECGNYKELRLEDAKREAVEFLPVIREWTAEKLRYRQK